MELKDKISEWIDAHREDLIRDTKRLVDIKSVKGEPAPGAPFGEGPRKALDEALAICGNYGFAVKDYDGYVGTADFNPELPPALDILGHLDVVAEGPGWFSDPYFAGVMDDYLCGRGTDDDKGPTVAALLAMRCVRELGLPLKGNVRLIMGTDEESGSNDLPYYFAREKSAPCTFTPDTGFPVYNVEKGHYKPEISMRFPPETALPRVSSIEAGFRINVIPSEANAVVLGLDALEVMTGVMAISETCGAKIEVSPVPGGARLTSFGTQGHAAYPEEANNAVTALLAALYCLPLADCASTRAVMQLATLFPHGDWRAFAAGLAMGDVASGDLTASFNLLSLSETHLKGQLDCRVPICANDQNCKNVFESKLSAAGFAVTGEMEAAHNTPGDSDFVRTLLECYETFTGEKGECRYTGGGTYVHNIEGGVGFGASMPGFETHLHGANERMSIKDTLTAAKIYALAIAKICG